MESTLLGRTIKNLEYVSDSLQSAVSGEDGNTYSKKAQAQNKTDLVEVKSDLEIFRALAQE